MKRMSIKEKIKLRKMMPKLPKTEEDYKRETNILTAVATLFFGIAILTTIWATMTTIILDDFNKQIIWECGCE